MIFMIHFHFQLSIKNTFDPFSFLSLQSIIERPLQEPYFRNTQLLFILILKTILKVHPHKEEL